MTAIKLSQKFVYDVKLPSSAYFYKQANGKVVYKDRYEDKFYVISRVANGWLIEEYKGQCPC